MRLYRGHAAALYPRISPSVELAAGGPLQRADEIAPIRGAVSVGVHERLHCAAKGILAEIELRLTEHRRGLAVDDAPVRGLRGRKIRQALPDRRGAGCGVGAVRSHLELVERVPGIVLGEERRGRLGGHVVRESLL